MQQLASTYSVLTHTLGPLGGIKGQNIFFLKVVMVHIKFMGMEHRTPCKHIVYSYFMSVCSSSVTH